MLRRLHGLFVKEFAQMLRDPVVLFLVFWLYSAELVMCTMALGFDVKNLRLGVVDNDRTVVSRGLIEELTSADTFILSGQYASFAAAGAELRKGRLDAVLEIPPNLGARLQSGRRTTLGAVVDGSNATVATRARAYFIELVARYTARHAHKEGRARPGVEASVRIWYNPDLTNTRFMALGMLAQAGFMLAVVLPAAAMVREKQNGTMEQIRVTPIRAHELFLAKVVPTIVLSEGALFPALVVTRLIGVPMEGNLGTLLVLNVIFLLSAVAIGVFVACITRTLQQSMLVSFFSLFPLLFLSGSVAPVESMPKALQAASLGSPLRHFTEIVSGLFLKGSGIAELWLHAAALGFISVLMFSGAWLIFRRSW
ncbi:ABC transporter permease [Sphingopyxis sp. GW247-27LB]|uniref:ABC transporter permease n=1 Tax=Sphingopyxis sp. GW247-27LB TaxID=2012632 RepID=UPI000BA576EA|nr:ABC transporter permease [Sphingopyxis sp. GW247-27LB]PAL19761.1 ABC transporter permease [Sphingopyxis sp. GW247-27LB]